MKYTFWAYGLIALGVAILVGLRFVNDLTTTSEADYYLTKEVMEASLLDSIDYGVYRRYGDVRIKSLHKNRTIGYQRRGCRQYHREQRIHYPQRFHQSIHWNDNDCRRDHLGYKQKDHNRFFP